MKALVTGASGFVGAVLAARLREDPHALGRPLDQLILADVHFAPDAAAQADPRVMRLAGSIGDKAYLDQLVAHEPDVVFHLASIPGGAAERDQALGAAINLHATVRLLELLADQGSRGAAGAPIMVFTSTVAVYGAPLPAVVNADTPLRPVTSYGAHKLMTELLLTDMARRGVLDGRSVRLPGIVARPPEDAGLVSAFMSDLIHRLAAGEPFTCPVSPQATCWWMSVGRCVDNLLQAARIKPEQLAVPGMGRAWPLPVLRFSIGELVQALADQYGADRLGLIRYEPIERVEIQFGSQPPLDSAAARALGMQDDGDIATLIRRALAAR
jgi:nucleoside-diphosphate-sugar epimerase